MGVSFSVRVRLLRACFSFLVPVARFLLRCGISYREFSEVCRVAFVRVARDEFGIRGRPTNFSRISAMTGISRKEVSRLTQLMPSYDIDERMRLSPLSDVLHHWYTSKVYTDSEGNPIPLSFDGSELSFEKLVHECVGDLPVGAVKKELIRHGAVRLDDQGLILPIRREVVPLEFDRKLVSSISFNLASLAHTIAYNSDPDRRGPGRIERFVQSDDLSMSSKDRLRPIIRERIESFSRQLDDLFGLYATEQIESKNRIGVGMYFFEEDLDR